jgi:hypothetical protein
LSVAGRLDRDIITKGRSAIIAQQSEGPP